MKLEHNFVKVFIIKRGTVANKIYLNVKRHLIPQTTEALAFQIIFLKKKIKFKRLQALMCKQNTFAVVYIQVVCKRSELFEQSEMKGGYTHIKCSANSYCIKCA